MSYSGRIKAITTFTESVIDMTMRTVISKICRISISKKAVMFTMACLAICNAGYYTFKLLKSMPNGPGAVASGASKFIDIKTRISQQASVGYLSDHKPGSMEAGASYFQAQYHLAPIIVKNNADAEFLVGEFTSPPTSTAILRIENQRQLKLVKNYKNGVLFFRNVKP